MRKKRNDEGAGLRLRKSRESIGVSQTDLAKRAGVSPMLISMIEAGKRGFTDNSRNKIFGALATLGDEIAQAKKSPTFREQLMNPRVSAQDKLAIALMMDSQNNDLRMQLRIAEAHAAGKPLDQVTDALLSKFESMEKQLAVLPALLSELADLRRLLGLRTEAIIKTEEADTLHAEIERKTEPEPEPLARSKAEYANDLRQSGYTEAQITQAMQREGPTQRKRGEDE